MGYRSGPFFEMIRATDRTLLTRPPLKGSSTETNNTVVMAQTAGRIVREVHDEPHIEGRRITVRFIRERVEGAGLDPETVADRHDLDLADVYRALAYYHDHPEEMREVERRREERIDEHRKEAVTGPDDIA